MAEKSIINYNFSNSEEKEKAIEILSKIKPFRKYDGDVPLEAMEKFINHICKKYKVRIGYVFLAFGIGIDKDKKENEYKRPYDCIPIVSDTGEHIAHINAYTMYELFVKLSILLYKKIKDGEIFER